MDGGVIVLGGLSTTKTDVVDAIEIMAKYYTKDPCSDAKRHDDSEPALRAIHLNKIRCTAKSLWATLRAGA